MKMEIFKIRGEERERERGGGGGGGGGGGEEIRMNQNGVKLMHVL